MDLRDERDLAYQRLLKICQAGFLSISDFRCFLNIYERIQPLVVEWQGVYRDVLQFQLLP